MDPGVADVLAGEVEAVLLEEEHTQDGVVDAVVGGDVGAALADGFLPGAVPPGEGGAGAFGDVIGHVPFADAFERGADLGERGVDFDGLAEAAAGDGSGEGGFDATGTVVQIDLGEGAEGAVGWHSAQMASRSLGST